MEVNRWVSVKSILEEALQLPTDEREAFIAQACAQDEDLLSMVQMLVSNETAHTDALMIHPASKQVMLQAEEQLGPYMIEQELGQGGMGVVYLASRVNDFQKKVAIKVMKPILDDGSLIKHFQKERQILADLEHPNIARILDGGTTPDGLPYFVMEYVVGTPIDRYCQEHKLTLVQKLKLFLKVMEAVSFAHQNLVLHRDLKPSNILVTGEGRPVLLDFGIAALLDPKSEMMKTTHTSNPMTLAYASPEQVNGERFVVTSDVYSLGVMLHELITGNMPYPITNTPLALLQAISGAHAERPGETFIRLGDKAAAKQVKGDIDSIVHKAMMCEPRARYASVEAFAEDIRRHLTGLPLRAQKITRLYLVKKFVQRHRWRLAVASVFFVLLFGAATLIWMSSQQANFRRTQAEDLISFMLFDLRGKLEAVGKQEILGDAASKAMGYFESLPAGELNMEEQARMAEALRQVGQVRLSEGKNEGALDAFAKALKVAEQLCANHPDNHDFQLNLGFSHYWLGYVYYHWEQPELARPHFQSYHDITKALVDIDPHNNLWLLELSYAQTNLGGLLRQQQAYEEALEWLSLSAKTKGRLVTLDPENLSLRAELAGDYSWLGTLHRELGRNHDAVNAFLRAGDIYDNLLALQPDNRVWRYARANNANNTAWAMESTHQADEVLGYYQNAMDEINALLAFDSTNQEWREMRAFCGHNAGLFARKSQKKALAMQYLETARDDLLYQLESNPENQRHNFLISSALLGLVSLCDTDKQAGKIQRLCARALPYLERTRTHADARKFSKLMKGYRSLCGSDELENLAPLPGQRNLLEE